METFALYPQAWLAYVALGLALLFMLDLKLRKTNFKLRAGILSLIAVGAFTPQTVADADTMAPLILTSVLNAEMVGASAIYKGLVTLLIVWGIVFAASLAFKYFIDAKKGPSQPQS
ncbi:hypothetical protein [Aliikangiella coralliicola]|uniref:Uncharacterized protein n=1 Tax=Aliikangiella coralliicola TaxID=2592383 RepID=A0A545UDF8_9GAMM|nr:hypothetical protein [Aliikangiella coralliicola]TQV87489.1 hypothetical protein FLL46_11480 [Aliikangiella coralliicola]